MPRSASARPTTRNLAWWAQHHFGVLRAVCFGLCSAPALWLALQAALGTLGVNALARLLHFSGGWALTLLLVTLAVTPLRRLSMRLAQHVHARHGKRLSDWNWLIRLRRQLGLFAFSYASLHLALYALLDAGLDPAALQEDLQERPYIVLGALAYALLLPLAVTSHPAAMRALGGWWARLHRLVYAVAALGFLHVWLQMKVGQHDAWPYAAAVLIVLLLRLAAWRRGEAPGAVEARRQGVGHRRPT